MTSVLYCLLVLALIQLTLNATLHKQDITIVSNTDVGNIVKLHPIPEHIAIKLHAAMQSADHLTKLVNLHVSAADDSKVHPIINLIPEVKKDDHLLLTKSLLETKPSREKKAYPIIGHVFVPANIHYIPVQDLTVIPLRRENKPLFRAQVISDYEQNVFQSYYGGYGTGLNFGGHGAGHGFYAYG